MGTWDVGPFDNDTAADWCAHLDEAAPEHRMALIREALIRVAERGADFVDSREAEQALAAAAVVASALPDGAAIDSPYAPGFVTEGGRVEVAGDVPAIAVRALDRIVGDDSEWRELWEETEESTYAQALASVRALRDVLAHPAGR
ncbi:DUF4259 domain-containing protein [Catenuloplanes indicus]|uniref:DUF4259 domain-containing protein n=1 Tax=Catenuloplanes indicus TaxID=137267 RepID=A0AAE4AVV3_9ACTN|nr:DUF4259 domain-containing protein [Catenuloplanes indicus]MDQ0364427.1 hypothetical protein [Catenuloplanes indicus]